MNISSYKVFPVVISEPTGDNYVVNFCTIHSGWETYKTMSYISILK